MTYCYCCSFSEILTQIFYFFGKEITSYIKLQNHEKRKRRAYQEDMGEVLEYEIFKDEHYYVCHNRGELRRIRTEKKEQDSYSQTLEVYERGDCDDCEYKYPEALKR